MYTDDKIVANIIVDRYNYLQITINEQIMTILYNILTEYTQLSINIDIHAGFPPKGGTRGLPLYSLFCDNYFLLE